MGCIGKASGNGICMYMLNLPLEGTVGVNNKEWDEESIEKNMEEGGKQSWHMEIA